MIKPRPQHHTSQQNRLRANIIFISILVICTSYCNGQAIVLKLNIYDKINEIKIPSAQVYLKSNNTIIDSSKSDLNGYVRFDSIKVQRLFLSIQKPENEYDFGYSLTNLEIATDTINSRIEYRVDVTPYRFEFNSIKTFYQCCKLDFFKDSAYYEVKNDDLYLYKCIDNPKEECVLTKSLLKHLKRDNKLGIEIFSGCCDEEYKKSSNKLSNERAKQLKNYFVMKGIDSKRIKITLLGTSQPTLPSEFIRLQKPKDRVYFIQYNNYTEIKLFKRD